MCSKSASYGSQLQCLMWRELMTLQVEILIGQTAVLITVTDRQTVTLLGFTHFPATPTLFLLQEVFTLVGMLP